MELRFRSRRAHRRGTTGMAVRRPASAGHSSRSNALEHGAHVPHGAVAQERHRAVRDPALRLDLGPPHAAMADAHPVDVERLGDDHMVDPRPGEQPLPREIGDPAIAARFLVDGAGDLQRPGQLGKPLSSSVSTATIAAASPPFMSQVPRP